jgi:hypothetical protein
MKRLRKVGLLAAVLVSAALAAPAAAVVPSPLAAGAGTATPDRAPAAAVAVRQPVPAARAAAPRQASAAPGGRRAGTVSTGTVSTAPAAGSAGTERAGSPPVVRLAAGCYGTGCTGKLAAAQGCRDDRIKVAGFRSPASGTWAAADFTLWHSVVCHSAWAEYDSAGDGSGRLELFSWIDQYGGVAGRYDVLLGPAGNYPTPMVTWDDSVMVCGDTFSLECTGWR